jgi:membrane complex biogenesis BtpA family protein
MFGRKCSVIGAVHVPPLPGSPNYSGSIELILEQALSDALTYKDEGVDSIILENMHDVPYLKGRVEPETTAAMSVVANAIKYETMLPIGVQLLAGANIEALGVALACGADFIRVEGFVFAHVGDEGIHESCAAELVRRRKYLQAERIKIFADIKKKHSSHAITGDVSVADTAKAAEFFKADAVVVSGSFTGEPPELPEVKAVRQSVQIPVIVGSGIAPDNIKKFIQHADAVIVGTALKLDGRWQNAVDPERVARLVAASSI